MDGCGAVVGALAFYSSESRSNLSEANTFFFKMLLKERKKRRLIQQNSVTITKKRLWMGHKKCFDRNSFCRRKFPNDMGIFQHLLAY